MKFQKGDLVRGYNDSKIYVIIEVDTHEWSDRNYWCMDFEGYGWWYREEELEKVE